MKKPTTYFALLLLVALFASCKDGETYAEQKNKERKAIDAFIQRDIVVRDEDGTVVQGGEYTVTKQVVPITKDHNDVHVHHFSGTLPGERYSLTLEEDYHFISIKDLCLVYEN